MGGGGLNREQLWALLGLMGEAGATGVAAMPRPCTNYGPGNRNGSRAPKAPR